MTKIFFFNNVKNTKGLQFHKDKGYSIIEEDKHYYCLEDEQGELVAISKKTINLMYEIEEDEYEETFY